MGKLKKGYADKSSLELVRALCKVAIDTKAEDLVVLDVQKMTTFTDYFIIMSGRSTRHVQGLAATLEHELQRKRLKDSNTEGLAEGHWVLLDFNDVIVHVFYHEVRPFYDLEGLWHAAPRVEL